MKVVVRSKAPSDKVAAWSGKHPSSDHYGMCITGDIDLLGPNGKPVIIVRKKAIPPMIINATYGTFDWMKRFTSDNRGNYAGAYRSGHVIKKDGTKSKQTRALDKDGKPIQITSTIAGYFEGQGGRNPFCRASLITRTEPNKWKQALPLMKYCASLYKRVAPIKYKKQMEYVNKTDQAWVIPDTPFTTITVNNSVAAAYHQDAGDLKDGMGVMAVLAKGEFKGFELVIPEYNCAVRLGHGDVIIFDPTIWHENIPPYDTVGERNVDWQRISIVMYYREGILGCKSPEEELKNAKQRGAF